MILIIGVIIYLYMLYKQLKDKLIEDSEKEFSFNNNILFARSLDVMNNIPCDFHLYPNSPIRI